MENNLYEMISAHEKHNSNINTSDGILHEVKHPTAPIFSTQDIQDNDDYKAGWDACIRAIYQCLFNVDMSPIIHGHWIIHDDKYGRTEECSVCHVEGMMHSPYCYRCGAKMDEKTTRSL